MRFKLDENFGVRTQALFRAAGHDVETVSGERLCGCDDERLYQVCGEELPLVSQVKVMLLAKTPWKVGVPGTAA